MGARAIIWLALAVIGLASARAQEGHIRPKIPVTIQGGRFDACPSNGIVVGLDPNGDGFLAVKDGPGLSFPRIDMLYNGERVYLCGETKDWFGVVYTKDQQDCNVLTAWPETLPYTGPCRSGWVFKRYIQSSGLAKDNLRKDAQKPSGSSATVIGALDPNDLKSIAREPDALLLATLSNDIELIQALIRAGANVNTRDEGGWSPLAHAAANGNAEAASVLIAAKARTSAPEISDSPIVVAAVAGSVGVLSAILRADKPPAAQINEALSIVATRGDEEAVAVFALYGELRGRAIVEIKHLLGQRIGKDLGSTATLDVLTALAAVKFCRDAGLYERHPCLSEEFLSALRRSR